MAHKRFLKKTMASALALNEKVDLNEEINELKKAFAINIDFYLCIGKHALSK